MTQYRFIKSVVKNLKRKYGQPVTLINITKGNIDWSQGSSSNRSVDTKEIKKALVLVGKTTNLSSLSSIATKEFSYGGNCETVERTIIIDRDDLGTFGFTKKSKVKFSNYDYTIVDFIDYEEQNSIAVFVTRVEGQINE
jgi:hypothetical protein